MTNDSLSGHTGKFEVNGIQVTTSFYGTDPSVIQNDNCLFIGIAARGQDHVHGGSGAIDWGYLYGLMLQPSISPNPVLYIAVYEVHEWEYSYKVIKSTYVIWPDLTVNSYATLSMRFGADYIYYSITMDGSNHYVDVWASNATAFKSFSVGTTGRKFWEIPLPGTVKYLQFSGAWSKYNIDRVGWYTHLSSCRYELNGSWINVPFAYSTNGDNSWMDNTFRWGGVAYDDASAYFGPQYVHFSYNSEGITLPPDTLLWEPIGGGGGCPYAYAWNGHDFMIDNNLLPASEISGGNDVEDYYKLEQQLVPAYQGTSFSMYPLQIREFEHEHDYFDQTKLLAVDHNSNVNVAVSPYGEILTYGNPNPPISAFDETGTNVLSQVNSIDSNYYQGHNESYVILTFSHTEILDRVKLVIREDRPPVLKCPVYIQVINGIGC